MTKKKRQREADDMEAYWMADEERPQVQTNAQSGYLPATTLDPKGVRFIQAGQLERRLDGPAPHVVDTREQYEPVGAGRGHVNPPVVKP
jgi:hypothetical protein